jgi:stage II sporulation protein D
MTIPSDEPIIKVGILAEPTIQFELKGDFLLNSAIVPAGVYSVSIDGNVLSCTPSTSNYSTSNKLELIPQLPTSTFILKKVTIGIGFHWEKQEDQEFEGGLTLQIEGDKIRAINTVALESYLKSVISSEMSAMNDANLLNAHAIVSRSWLLAQILKKNTQQVLNSQNKSTTGSIIKQSGQSYSKINEIVKWYDREDHDTFDVCADDHCQRYQGITKVISANAQKAIEATSGKVLMFDNEICDARFSKCCGGISEDFENVWQPVKVPYLVAIRDIDNGLHETSKGKNINAESFITTSPEAFCNTTDSTVLSQVLIDFDRSTTNFYRWTVEHDQKTISALIEKKSGIEFGEIADIVPLERGNSGRIIRLKIVGTKKETIVGKELEIRKWLSESHLYSSAFIVEKEFENNSAVPSKFILRGAGWGHGVGMCQIGAAMMSKKGYTSDEILKHYFKDAKVKKIY